MTSSESVAYHPRTSPVHADGGYPDPRVYPCCVDRGAVNAPPHCWTNVNISLPRVVEGLRPPLVRALLVCSVTETGSVRGSIVINTRLIERITRRAKQADHENIRTKHSGNTKINVRYKTNRIVWNVQPANLLARIFGVLKSNHRSVCKKDYIDRDVTEYGLIFFYISTENKILFCRWSVRNSIDAFQKRLRSRDKRRGVI